MTFREQCAHDAYNSALRAMESRGVDRDGSNEEMGNDLAEVAWAYADAMEAQRLKRIPPPRPKPINDPDDIGADAPPRLTADQIAAVAQARREGRDAGLVAAVQVVARRRFHSDFPRDKRTLQDAWEAISALRAKDAPAAPDIASLQAELAKLRAVAEAAAAVQRGRHQDGLNDGPITARLTDALDAALPSWRTK